MPRSILLSLEIEAPNFTKKIRIIVIEFLYTLYSGTPKFCLGLLLFLLEESRTPVFKILERSLNAFVCTCISVRRVVKQH